MIAAVAKIKDQEHPYNDIVAKHGVEIQIQKYGLIVWVNVDGINIARIITNGFVPITVEDARPQWK